MPQQRAALCMSTALRKRVSGLRRLPTLSRPYGPPLSWCTFLRRKSTRSRTAPEGIYFSQSAQIAYPKLVLITSFQIADAGRIRCTSSIYFYISKRIY